ncbi:rhodanese-like domain-containing protein [Patescibacteria group bacterium]|nr:rhodanese-like domain-containing protein [Patescibacteria group bacterium]
MSKTNISIIIIILIIIGYFGYQQMGNKAEVITDENTEEIQTLEYMDISVAEAMSLIETNPELVIIDVSPNYAEGHLPGAINYYVGDGSLDAAIPSLDKNGEYLVYCHFDSAAIAGAQKLIDAGFTTVYRLEGNYSGWVDAGYPTEK